MTDGRVTLALLGRISSCRRGKGRRGGGVHHRKEERGEAKIVNAARSDRVQFGQSWGKMNQHNRELLLRKTASGRYVRNGGEGKVPWP